MSALEAARRPRTQAVSRDLVIGTDSITLALLWTVFIFFNTRCFILLGFPPRIKVHSIIRILYHLIQNDTTCQFEEKANCLLGVLGFPPFFFPPQKGKKKKKSSLEKIPEHSLPIEKYISGFHCSVIFLR